MTTRYIGEQAIFRRRRFTLLAHLVKGAEQLGQALQQKQE